MFTNNTDTGSGSGGLFSNSTQNNSSSGGGGLFGNSSSNNNNSSSGGGGLFGNSSSNNSGGGGLFGNSSSNSSGGGGLFGNSSSNNNNNNNNKSFNANLAPKGFFTGDGLDQNSKKKFNAGNFGQNFGMGNNGYGNGLMNAYGLLRNGYNQANAYSMMKNNLLFEDKNEFDKNKMKKDKNFRIKRFEFLTQKPKNWIFELPKGNPLAKKKVKDLPDKYKQYITKVSLGLKKNKKDLEEIKQKSKSLIKEVDSDMKDLIHDNVLSLKLINIKLTKFTNSLKEVTELMKYFEIIVGQLKRYFELLKSNHMKVYTIPSQNAVTVSALLKNRLENCKSIITELTSILAKEKNSAIPENTIRLYSGIIEQLYTYLLVVLKKGDQLEKEVGRLIQRYNVNLNDANDGRMEVVQNKGGISGQLDAIERMLRHK